MTKIELFNSVTRALHKAKFGLKKHSPEILVVTGVVGTVTSAVMACKATTKVDFILEETKDKIDIIHRGVEKGEVKSRLENGEVAVVPYSEQDGKKDLSIVYAQTGLKFVKLYGPAVLLGAASIACILTSHKILRARNIAIAAAYATVDQGFKDYRGRVIERFGKELDRELKYDIKSKEIEETVVNEDGTEQTVTKVVDVANTKQLSGYDRCFDETSSMWDRDAERNKWFILQQQNYANDKLKSQGYLFLNDVYKMLGFPPSAAGQVVGWIYDEEHPNGDNYVDFGMYDIHDEAKRRFANGFEKSIWLDFNVDGDILNLLP